MCCFHGLVVAQAEKNNPNCVSVSSPSPFARRPRALPILRLFLLSFHTLLTLSTHNTLLFALVCVSLHHYVFLPRHTAGNPAPPPLIFSLDDFHLWSNDL